MTYAIDKLMTETRRLAAAYYQTTKQTLPVGSELAKYDVSRILQLRPPEKMESGVDALDRHGQRIQIKSRVIFKDHFDGYRIGQLNTGTTWDKLILLLMDPQYEPFEIYEASRESLEEAMLDHTSQQRQKRGAMSINKCIAISLLVWTSARGMEPGFDYV